MPSFLRDDEMTADDTTPPDDNQGPHGKEGTAADPRQRMKSARRPDRSSSAALNEPAAPAGEGTSGM